MQKISEPLSLQLFDLRASVVKEVCKTISLMAQVLESNFEQQAGTIFMTDQALFKLMESSNGVMAESGHSCVLSILYSTTDIK